MALFREWKLPLNSMAFRPFVKGMNKKKKKVRIAAFFSGLELKTLSEGRLWLMDFYAGLILG